MSIVDNRKMENINTVFTVNGSLVKKWKVTKTGRKYVWLEGGKRVNIETGEVEGQVDKLWLWDVHTYRYYENKEDAIQAALKNRLITHITGFTSSSFTVSLFLQDLSVSTLEVIYMDCHSQNNNLMPLDTLKRLHEDANNG